MTSSSPMLRASTSFIEVTTFQAARPRVIRSSVWNRRATWRGSRSWSRWSRGRAARGHGHRHQAGDRVHLDAADAVRDGLREAPAVELRHAQAVVEEGQLELAGLQHPADAGVVVGRQKVAERSGWRHEPAKFEQFCACRNPIRIMSRMRLPPSLPLPGRYVRSLPTAGVDAPRARRSRMSGEATIGGLSRRSTWPSGPAAAAG